MSKRKLFAISEPLSPMQVALLPSSAGLIWAGSDDEVVAVVATPAQMKKFIREMRNRGHEIDACPHEIDACPSETDAELNE